jgi:hypothetical protein
MSSISVTAVVILVLVSIAAFAQKPGDLFRNSDIRPSGYIDFYGMPSPPEVPAPNTALLPNDQQDRNGDESQVFERGRERPFSSTRREPIPELDVWVQGWGFELCSEDLARQAGQAALLCGLPAVAGQMRDHQGKNDGDDSACHGRRDTGARCDLFQHPLAEALLNLIRTDRLILPWTDPGLNLFTEAVLF